MVFINQVSVLSKNEHLGTVIIENNIRWVCFLSSYRKIFLNAVVEISNHCLLNMSYWTQPRLLKSRPFQDHGIDRRLIAIPARDLAACINTRAINSVVVGIGGRLQRHRSNHQHRCLGLSDLGVPSLSVSWP